MKVKWSCSAHSRTVYMRWAGACSMYGGQEKHMQGFGGKNVTGRDHLEDLRMLNWILNDKDGRASD